MEALKRVAIVDDDLRVLESLDDLLAAWGLESMLFASAELFLGAQCLSEIACVISDIGLPRMNGWDLADAVRAIRPDLPVILITGRESERDDARVRRGDFLVLRKPFDGSELLKALASLKVNPHSRIL